MRWWLWAALYCVPLQAAEGKREVLVLSSPNQRARESVLVDALRIYTRDLGRTVRLGGSAPASLDPEELVRIADSAEGAEVAVWFGERAGLPVLFALRVDTLDVRDTPVELDDPQQAARALALKVRALLTQRTEAWTVAAPSPSPTPSPAPSPVEVVVAPSPSPAPVVVVVAERPRRTWVEISALYTGIVPNNLDWVRHGLLLRVAIPWRFLSFFVDTAFTTAPTVTVGLRPISARIWPVGAGLELRLRRPRWQIAVGPRVSLLVVDASAVGDNGRVGGAQLVTGGLGLVGDATWLFSKYVGALIQVGFDALFRQVQLAAGGPAQTDLGWVQFHFSVGLVLSIP